jgi:hypothetical protein
MSERDDDRVKVNVDYLTIVAVIVAVVVTLTYFEVDSRIQLSYIRDLQRRVGQLEPNQQPPLSYRRRR